MAEPTTIAMGMPPDVAKAVGGLIGGAVVLSIDPPRSRTDTAIRLVVAPALSFGLTGLTMRKLGWPTDDVEQILGVGLVWGALGWFVVSLLVRFFTKRQASGADALDVGREIRDAVTGRESKP